MKILLAENRAILEQALGLLAQLSDAQYRQCLPQCFNASIGGHVRHTLDHYMSFVSGLQSGAVDYEARARDTQLETDRRYALEAIATLCDQLSYLPTAERSIRIRMENAEPHAPHAWAVSSGRRELQFLLSHTIHHYALIAISCRLLGVEPPADFGIAPSTLRYRESQTAKVA